MRRASPIAPLGVLLVLLSLSALAAEGRRRAAVGRTEVAEIDVPPVSPDAGPPPSPAAEALREGRPMDVNTATRADLQLLPRIGPALADRIVADREERGPFESLESLSRVRGIGPKTVDRLRGLAAVGPERVGPPLPER